MSKITTEIFKEKCSKIHGGRYVYDKTIYTKANNYVLVTCPIHGDFRQRASNHLRGVGCPKCGGSSKMNKDIFVKKSIEIHGDKYDYSNVEYVNTKTKVCIVCPEHGEFWQNPDEHLKGKGCPKCAKNKNLTKEEFIERCKKQHNEFYDYSKVKYVNLHGKITVICPIHGEFQQRADHHLNGSGCPKCKGGTVLTNDMFLKKCREKYGERYNYENCSYEGWNKKVIITCPEHGDFEIIANSFLQGSGCPVCSKKKSDENKITPFEEVVKKAQKIHGNKYIYHKETYTKLGNDFLVTCPTHGDFWQNAYYHINGYDCPKCTSNYSKKEGEIADFLRKQGLFIKEKDKTVLEGLEIDILLPDLKIGIEYNGLHWHSEEYGKDKSYHLKKTQKAKEKGYLLIHIFEDEYIEHQEIVLQKLLYICHKQAALKRCGARETEIKKISVQEARIFLEKYHIQGFAKSTVYYGAFNKKDEIIGVMSFKRESNDDNKWELTRFATDYHYIYPGLGSKMFKYFLKVNNPTEVKSFADRRWTLDETDNLYTKLGFELESTLKPDYRYVIGHKRHHKFNFRKQILHRKYGLALSMTEKEMCDKLGFYRIWDCGLFKYVWKKY